jgi:glycosyltransferase involved in cell wall biosynthesis
MRVTHVITRLIVGGAQENTVASVLGLARKPDMEVDLLSGQTAGPEGSLAAKFEESSGKLTIVENLVRPVHPWRDWLGLFELTNIFRRNRPEIVHTHSGKAGVLGRFAAHRAGVPVIIHTIHGPSFGRFQGALANSLFQAAERAAGKVTTHFVSVADAMTEQYLAAGIGRPDQYTRIFSGFELAPYLAAQNDLALRARLGIGPEDFVLGKIARLFDLKGHDDLFAIAPELVRGISNLKILLVGDGPLRQQFEQKTRLLGLDKQIIFTGLVPPCEVPHYVGIMDLLVHLSQREGLPRALPQALAAGKPVVAYDCDGAWEVCQPYQTGVLVLPRDVAALRETIKTLAASPNLRAKFGQRGQMLVRRWFPVERMVDELHRLYLSLLAK